MPPEWSEWWWVVITWVIRCAGEPPAHEADHGLGAEVVQRTLDHDDPAGASHHQRVVRDAAEQDDARGDPLRVDRGLAAVLDEPEVGEGHDPLRGAHADRGQPGAEPAAPARRRGSGMPRGRAAGWRPPAGRTQLPVQPLAVGPERDRAREPQPRPGRTPAHVAHLDHDVPAQVVVLEGAQPGDPAGPRAHEQTHRRDRVPEHEDPEGPSAQDSRASVPRHPWVAEGPLQQHVGVEQGQLLADRGPPVGRHRLCRGSRTVGVDTADEAPSARRSPRGPDDRPRSRCAPRRPAPGWAYDGSRATYRTRSSNVALGLARSPGRIPSS